MHYYHLLPRVEIPKQIVNFSIFLESHNFNIAKSCFENFGLWMKSFENNTLIGGIWMCMYVCMYVGGNTLGKQSKFHTYCSHQRGRTTADFYYAVGCKITNKLKHKVVLLICCLSAPTRKSIETHTYICLYAANKALLNIIFIYIEDNVNKQSLILNLCTTN